MLVHKGFGKAKRTDESAYPPQGGFLWRAILTVRTEPSELIGTGDGFRTIHCIELVENRLDVAFHRFRADAQNAAEFLIGKTTAKMPEHFQFAGAQRRAGGSRGSRALRKNQPPGRHLADGLQQGGSIRGLTQVANRAVPTGKG